MNNDTNPRTWQLLEAAIAFDEVYDGRTRMPAMLQERDGRREARTVTRQQARGLLELQFVRPTSFPPVNIATDDPCVH